MEIVWTHPNNLPWTGFCGMRCFEPVLSYLVLFGTLISHCQTLSFEVGCQRATAWEFTVGNGDIGVGNFIICDLDQSWRCQQSTFQENCREHMYISLYFTWLLLGRRSGPMEVTWGTQAKKQTIVFLMWKWRNLYAISSLNSLWGNSKLTKQVTIEVVDGDCKWIDCEITVWREHPTLYKETETGI